MPRVPPVKKPKFTRNEFVAKAISIHGLRYGYGLIEQPYLNRKMMFSCPEHGIFEQYGFHHLDGRGCKQCGIIARSGRKPDHVILTCEKHGSYAVSNYRYRNGSTACPDCNVRDLTLKRSYYRAVRTETERQWRHNRGLIDPNFEHKPRGPRQFHLDHIFTVKDGFRNLVDPELVSHYSNLQLVWWEDNISRGAKHLRSFETLILTHKMAVDFFGY